MAEINTESYKQSAAKAIDDIVLQNALLNVQNRLGPATALAYKNLPEGPGQRQKAHEIRESAINNLDILLETLAAKIRDRGGKVFFAKDAAQATAYCLKVAKKKPGKNGGQGQIHGH